MSARYYYVDSQNQAAGPVSATDLTSLRSAGTIQDGTLVVMEGGQDWVAFSTLALIATTPAQPVVAAQPAPTSLVTAQPAPAQTAAPSGKGDSSEPAWATQFLMKMDALTVTADRILAALEKSPAIRAATTPVPATASLHAEKLKPLTAPKLGIAQGASPTITSPSPGGAMPAGIPRPMPLPGTVRPATLSSPLAPLAVPANAVKSAVPLPALGVVPTPTPSPVAPAKQGNIFSKFLKK